MRRSSRIALLSAVILLGCLGIVFLAPQDRNTAQMNSTTADAFLHSGRQMLEAGDSNGIIDLFTPDSRVLGATPERLKSAVMAAVQEMNGRPLTAVFRNVSVKTDNGGAYLTFDLDIDENQKGAVIHYFTSHVNLTLKKAETPHLFGLYRTTDWKISQLDADPPFGIIEE